MVCCLKRNTFYLLMLSFIFTIYSFHLFFNTEHFWGLTYDTHTTPVFLLQKKVFRAISFEHFTSPSTPLFRNLKILKLQDLFHLKLLTFVYKCVNKISPTYFHSFFDLVESVHQYGTRQATRNDISLKELVHCVIAMQRCGIRKRFLCSNWNVPGEIKKSISVISFRKNLKSYLFNNVAKTDCC